jgi:hypothetical protein
LFGVLLLMISSTHIRKNAGLLSPEENGKIHRAKFASLLTLLSMSGQPFVNNIIFMSNEYLGYLNLPIGLREHCDYFFTFSNVVLVCCCSFA